MSVKVTGLQDVKRDQFGAATITAGNLPGRAAYPGESQTGGSLAAPNGGALANGMNGGTAAGPNGGTLARWVNGGSLIEG